MKRLLPWLITILLAITLIVVAAFFIYDRLFNDSGSGSGEVDKIVEQVEPEKLTADERVEMTAEIQDIRTNLLDTNYVVVMSLAFRLDSKKAKEEFEKIKDISIKPIIIRTLSDMTEEELRGSKGKDELNARLFNLINPELTHGRLTKVEITNIIIQRI
ncbi:Flagellar basal body-associated protein FliL [Thermobacillus xylanilyticus]|jgi:flagellar FliL protein|uniref:Flagellar protein FliL n=1 Tax=Thermobacillus xylanilyticus TaxID=76633 RepID=A0ABM8UZZ5_THEXY|nr:flagellar basal body-associated FliL family protein [Thermobacillus xylanilyticus]CAG5077848.1 Flagellar basal body-associated protein FliL [Thermobacillus xylanilyticus]